MPVAGFVVPDSPPGEVDPEMMKKYLKLVQTTKRGGFVNDHIRNAKKFRNPDLLEKLVAFMGVQEFGTNYPAELYDPNGFGKEEYYEKLEETRRKWEERQSRKEGEKVDFRSAGQLEQRASSSSGAAPAEAAPPKRKSKWDTGGAGSEPAAQRPRL